MAANRNLWMLCYFIICFYDLIYISNCLKTFEVNKLLEGRYDFKDSMRQQLGGKFTVGINDPKSENGEYPVRATEVKPFYMDMYPVTVAQFWKYAMKKPKYKTAAEKNGYSWVLEKFVTDHVKSKWSSESAEPWWLAVKGAQWNRPEGPGSHVRDRLNFPVVHVSYSDAKAYCMWVGKRLPIEDEWEYAARGQSIGLQYPWGDKFKKQRMNVWQGPFPDEDKGLDGHKGLSPVDAFPSQNNHSMYDMLGNVWEWTSTRYYERVVDRKLQDLKYVLKGGSYMDTRDGKSNYAARTSNRMGQAPPYSAHNVGFRCAANAPHLVKKQREKDPRYRKTMGSTKRPPKLHRRDEMANPPPKTNNKRQRKFEL